MKRFKAFRPDPAMEGRRLQVEGLPEEVGDSAVKRYFQVEHRLIKLAKLPCYYLDNYPDMSIAMHCRGLVLLVHGKGRKGGIVPRVISPTRNQAWQTMP